jgi:hypothetical protein
MEESSRDETTRATSVSNAHHKPDPNVSWFKYYRDGTPHATSISDARNAYNESALCDEVYCAASASVRKID